MEKRSLVKGAVDDLVLLETISEDAIMVNLAATFKQDRIYVFIGPVLISLNPFKDIRGLYSPVLQSKYTRKYMWELAQPPVSECVAPLRGATARWPDRFTDRAAVLRLASCMQHRHTHTHTTQSTHRQPHTPRA